MKTSLFQLFALMTPVISLCIPAAVVADDNNKVYPGSMCVPENSSAYATPGIETPLGTIVNLNPDPIAVNCPIVRDNTTNTDGLRNVTVRVFIPEEAADLIMREGFGCILFSLDRFTEASPESIVRLPYPGVGRQSLEFSGEHRLTVSFPLGQYFLRCDLPPQAIILSYLVIEP